MRTVIRDYLHFRKQESRFIERNRDVIAAANLKILKIGLLVSVIIFTTVGIFFCFHTIYRAVLKRISCVLSEESAASGVAFYRYGGEEFIGITRKEGTDIKSVCNTIKRDVERLDISFPESPFGKVTVSIGFADNGNFGSADSDNIVRMADSALYSAKHKGRNCVCRYETETDFLKENPEIKTES